MRMPVLFLFALLLSACWQPGYDPDLIEAERFADLLGKPRDTFHVSTEGDSTEEGVYLPPRDPDYYRLGFGIVRFDGAVGIVGIVYGSDGKLRTPYGGYGQFDVFAQSAYFVPTAVDPASLVVWTNPNEQVARLTKTGYGGMEPTGSFPAYGAAGGPYVGGGTVVVSELLDRFHLASTAGGVLTVVSVELSGAEAFPAAQAVSAVLPPDELVFSEEAPAFAALSADGSDLYLSAALGDGTAATYVWRDYLFAAAPVRLDGIDRKVTGMLSDGRLYASRGDGMRIYDPESAKSFDLSYGSIFFAGERWDAETGRWLSRFTRATTVWEDSGEGNTFRVEIWEYPTEKLSRLAD